MRLKRLWMLLLALLLCMPALAEDGGNLLRNASFEELDDGGMPLYWDADAYLTQEGITLYGAADRGEEGDVSARIRSLSANDARLIQTVEVEPGSYYHLSGYISADVQEAKSDMRWGANLSVLGMALQVDAIYDTEGEWVYTELYGVTGPEQTEVTVCARLGGYSGDCAGIAEFDNLRLEKLDALPEGVTAQRWYTEPVAVQPIAEEEDDAESSPFWPYLLVISAVYAALGLLLVNWMNAGEVPQLSKKRRTPLFVPVGLVLAFVVRCIVAVRVEGYQVDVNCFRSWGATLCQVGPGGFYQSVSFCDYPPGYMLVLGLNHLLTNALSGLWGGAAPAWLPSFIIKLLPMLCDVAIAWLVYHVAVRRGTSPRKAGMLCLLTAFCPALIVNSAAWCQVDAVLALLLMLVCCLALEKKWHLLMPVYVLAVLMKPQALMVGPLGLIVFVDVLLKDRKQGKTMLQGVGAALVVALAIILPFMFGKDGIYLVNADGHFWLTALYADTLGSYPYATVNTANLYYLFGGNWSALASRAHWAVPLVLAALCIGWGFWRTWQLRARLQETKVPLLYAEAALMGAFTLAFIVMAVVGASWTAVGACAMALCFAVVIPLFLRANRVDALPYMGALLFLLLYVLGIKMHERYLFPAFALLALAMALRRDWRMIPLFVLLSVTVFVNEGIVLDNSLRLGSSMGHLNNDTMLLNQILSVLNLGAVVLGLYLGGVVSLGEERGESRGRLVTLLSRRETKRPTLESYHPDSRLYWKRLDTVLVLGVTCLYAVLALWNLGSTKAPQTMWTSSSMDENIVIDLGDHYDDFTVTYYCGVSYSDFSLAVSEDGETWSDEYWAQMREGQCYQWKYLVPSYVSTDGTRGYSGTNKLTGVERLRGRYVRVKAQQIGLKLGEIIFRDAEGSTIPATLVSQSGGVEESSLYTSGARAIDEPDSLEGEPGWYTGTYFDEIYHARTAKELLDGTTVYEWTHPPLGKVIMSWFVAIFGMTPFGWRFGGTLMGILMLPAMYVFGKQLTKRTDMAFAAMMMMALDCMHFTQTRIATIDSYPVLFIILSYLFMVRFMQRDITAEPVKRLLPDLALSGFFAGCAIASKWIGLYAGVGLALLYFWTCARHVRLSIDAIHLLKSGRKFTKDELALLRFRADKALKRLLVLCLWCVLFFVAVPVTIYLLAYIPQMAYHHPGGLGEFLSLVRDVQVSMYNYHATPGLGMDHAFYSPWYEWLTCRRPMYYAMSQFQPEGWSQSIFCFGNLVVWYAGLVGIAVTACVWAKRHVYALEGSSSPVHLLSEKWSVVPAMLLIGLLSQLLPWVLVPRGTYIYHYFASLPFLMLSFMMVLYWLTKSFPRIGRAVLVVFLVACAVFFVLLYPYASGIPAPTWWLDIGKKFLTVYYSL